MLTDLTFITGNPSKVVWLKRYLRVQLSHQSIDLPEIQSLDLSKIVTYKAQEAYKRVQKPVLVEDTSLRFTAMGKLPGPLIKWFVEGLGVEGLCRMLDVYDDRTATAEVMYGLHTGEKIELFHGYVEGTFADHPLGEHGHKWDKAFVPIGYTKTWGEMDEQETETISLRRPVLQKLEKYLKVL